MTLLRPLPHRYLPPGAPIFNRSFLYRTAPGGVVYSFNARIHHCSVKIDRPCGRLYAPDQWVGWDIRRHPGCYPVASGPTMTVAHGRALFDALTRPQKNMKRRAA